MAGFQRACLNSEAVCPGNESDAHPALPQQASHYLLPGLALQSQGLLVASVSIQDDLTAQPELGRALYDGPDVGCDLAGDGDNPALGGYPVSFIAHSGPYLANLVAPGWVVPSLK